MLVNDKQFGPLDFSHLAKLAREGVLKPETLVWRAGLQTWVAAETVGGLFVPAAAPPRKAPGLAELSLSPADRLPHAPADDAVTDGPIPPQAAGPGAKKANYFLRHWRGELSLPVSYWLNGWLASLVTFGVVTAIAANLNLRDDFVPALSLASIVSTWLVIALILGWQVVGTWRAAIKYRARGKTFWGGAAQVLLIIVVIQTLFEFVQTGFPKIREYYDIMAGDARVGKYTFRVLRDGEELEFAGGISFGAAKEFERFLDAMGGVRLIHLNSTGGRIREAQKIGDLIRSRKLSTIVSNECLSACTIIFLSGQDRLVSADARIGFHQPDFPGLTADERRDTIAAEEARLRALGLSAAFAHKANLAPPNEMWFPSIPELISEHAATKLVDADDFAMSGLALSDLTDERIEQWILTSKLYVLIRGIDPPTYQKILQLAVEGVRRGRSLTDMRRDIVPLENNLFFGLLPYASNENLVAFTQALVGRLTVFNSRNPKDCYIYLTSEQSDLSAWNAMSAPYDDLFEQEDELKTKILSEFAGKNASIPTPAELPSTGQIAAAMQAQFGDEVNLLRPGTVPADKYYRYCEVALALYAKILKLPPNQLTPALRLLYAKK